MLTIKKMILTDVPVTVIYFKWSGIVNGLVAAKLPCSACCKPIGDKLPFGIAGIANDGPGDRSLRLCNACGKKAESSVIESEESVVSELLDKKLMGLPVVENPNMKPLLPGDVELGPLPRKDTSQAEDNS